jgi:hypothetical protein
MHIHANPTCHKKSYIQISKKNMPWVFCLCTLEQYCLFGKFWCFVFVELPHGLMEFVSLRWWSLQTQKKGHEFHGVDPNKIVICMFGYIRLQVLFNEKVPSDDHHASPTTMHTPLLFRSLANSTTQLALKLVVDTTPNHPPPTPHHY